MKTGWIFSYKLKRNVSEEEFVELTKKLHDEVISKAKGFISWKHYLQDNTWTDFVLWESEGYKSIGKLKTALYPHKAVAL